MKLGKKKKQPFSSSLISQVLPTCWIAKFKQMGINSGQNGPETKQKGKWNSVPASTCSDAGKFYGGDGDYDAFWRLSFGEADEKFGGLKNCSRPAFGYNSDDDVEFLPSSCQNMVAHGNKSRIFTEASPCAREKVAEIRTARLRVDKEKKFRKGGQGVSEEKQLEFDGRKDCCISPLNPRDRYLRKTAENGSSEECFLSEWKRLKERNDQHRKSLYISREVKRKMPKQKSKARVYSPRTSSRPEICKIKAFEDMKKAKLNMKKKAKEKAIEDFKGLESLAVEKCSYDPQKDFRESMMEMIEERRISKPEELEKLLACYLTLNSDEYHHLIIKVFRQVWLQLTIDPTRL